MRDRSRNPNHGIAAVGAAVAALAFAATFWFEPVPPGLPGLGAAAFPRLVCLVLFAFSVLLGLKTAVADPEATPPLDRGAWLVFATCLLFLPAMAVLGIFGAIPLFLVVAGRLWGEVGWRTLVLNALGLTAALWLVFVKIFRLTLPSGWLGSVLGY